MKKSLSGIVAALVLSFTAQANAAIVISEVAAWGSGNSPYAADWFELTNTGTSAVNITGWTMDDDSNNPNSALLSGISSINANESVIFIELAGGGNATTLKNSFLSTWFGSSVPSGLKIGTYTQGVAGGVGLSASGDTVNIYSGTSGTLQAKVILGASDSSSPYQTFDNAAGLNGVTISQLSAVGTNGAFVAANDTTEIGSPGRISAVAAIPEPETYAMFLAGLSILGAISRKRKA